TLTMARTKLIRGAALALLAAPMIASCAPGGTAEAGAAALSVTVPVDASHALNASINSVDEVDCTIDISKVRVYQH
ncbi:MAG: hypothetical protein L0H28_12060, partial [Corynebacterium casei]|nr:hypothetical protein [Corynebacterium casei]